MPKSKGNCGCPSKEIVGISMTNCCPVAMEEDGVNCTIMKLFSLGIVTVLLKYSMLKLVPYTYIKRAWLFLEVDPVE
jgi:hypothetical protein